MNINEIQDNIDFTIIIPIYNAEGFLEHTIQSILNQTYKSFELLLVDDCSTDDSFLIAQRYERSCNQVHAIQLPANSGSASLPIKEGVSMAKGKFISVIGNDDIINETYFAKAHEILNKKGDIDVVIPFVWVKDSDTNLITQTYPDYNFDMSVVLSGHEACRMIMPKWTFSCNGMMVRKNLYEYLQRENPYTYMNSDELSSRILIYNARKVAFSKSSEYTYFLYANSITHKKSPKLFEILYTDTHLITFAEKYYDEPIVASMCQRMLINMKYLYKEYRFSNSYSVEEKKQIKRTFSETYHFLYAKRRNLTTMKSKLYLSNWCVFTLLCKIMYLIHRR